MVLASFQHRPGVHRGSTAPADAPPRQAAHVLLGSNGRSGTAGLDLLAEDLAARWTRLAEAFETPSEAPGAAIPPATAELARGIARDERRLHEEVAAIVP